MSHIKTFRRLIDITRLADVHNETFHRPVSWGFAVSKCKTRLKARPIDASLDVSV